MSPKDQMFLWGNNGQLYVLADKLPPGRYIVQYHMTASEQTLEETQKAFKQTHPKFVIIMPNTGSFPFSLSQYTQRLTIDNAVIYESSF